MKNKELSYEMEQSIGNRLKEAKAISGLTGNEIAKKAEMSPAQVSRMFNYKNTNMTIGSVLAISEAMGVSPAWLAFGIGEAIPKKTRKTKKVVNE